MAVEDAPFRVIADHARAATMLIGDGVIASNEGRGYVLRRIIRRALRYARHLGVDRPILCDLVPAVTRLFEGIYFLAGSGALEKRISGDLRAEEELFARTLTSGIDRIGEEIEAIRRRGEMSLSGGVAFRLYDTHGIPLDLISEIAQDEGLQVDVEGFEKAMDAQRARSHASARFQAADASVFETLALPSLHSEFRGYPEQDFVRLGAARVLAIVRGAETAGRIGPGETAEVITDRTIFYPEGGGQVGDVGTWSWKGGAAEVLDARRPVPGLIAHRIEVRSGSLSAGDTIAMQVDEWTRRRTQANHTGTHLLHAALRNVLGESARQMGSLVAPDRLRFDYAARAPLTSSRSARSKTRSTARSCSTSPSPRTSSARPTSGAIAFFGEKYGKQRSRRDRAHYSVELAAAATRDDRRSETQDRLRQGCRRVRRIEAVTSLGTVDLLRRDEEILRPLAGSQGRPGPLARGGVARKNGFRRSRRSPRRCA
jgi:alanyl-tRNA synthetase